MTHLKLNILDWMVPIVSFYERVLPFYNQGLGWLLPVVIVMIVVGIYARLQKKPTENLETL